MSIRAYLSKTVTLIKIFLTLPLSFVYFLSGFVPKNSEIWVFGSYHNKFQDNTKYFFKYITNNRKNIKAFWLTDDNKTYHLLQDQGYNVLKKYSLQGFWVSARAKVIVIASYRTNVNPYAIRNAFVVNLYHGTFLKIIEFDIPPGYNKNIYQLMRVLNRLSVVFPFHKLNYDMVTASSEPHKKILPQALKVNPAKVFLTGVPVNDVFINRSVPPDENKIILYLPTFRANLEYDYFSYNFDAEKWQRMLEEKQYYLVIKLHPNRGYEDNQYLKRFARYSRIKFSTVDEDVYDLLLKTDLLLTDYSSVANDFSVAGKPILFFAPDYEQYISEERPLYFDYREGTGNKRFYDWHKLRKFIKSNSTLDNIKNSDFIENIIKFKDGNCSERIYNTICSQIKI